MSASVSRCRTCACEEPVCIAYFKPVPTLGFLELLGLWTHTHTHTDTRTHTRIHTHTGNQTCLHMWQDQGRLNTVLRYIHTHRHTHTDTYTHTQTHTHAHRAQPQCNETLPLTFMWAY